MTKGYGTWEFQRADAMRLLQHYSVAAVAEALHVHPRTIYKWKASVK